MPMPSLIITVDLEEHAIPPDPPRFEKALEPLLDLFDEHGVRATFFVVGEMVESWQGPLANLANRGHEIGLHGFTHRYLRDLGPSVARHELGLGLTVLRDCLGVERPGFRAPYCSLTADTSWAPPMLLEEGFSYSSSVMPSYNPIAGYPGAPRQPFLWECGLLELPAPVWGIGSFALPFLGGAYLRLAPAALVGLAARGRSAESGDWSYSHPYDFDSTEPFFRRQGQSWFEARLLFAFRSRMLNRFARFVAPGTPTLGEYAQATIARGGLPVFSPKNR